MTYRRFLANIQYIGTKYSGWSFQQRNNRTPPGIAAVIVEKLNKFVGKDFFKNFAGSSRTDKGVHAVRNTFHVDIDDSRFNCDLQGNAIVGALNHHLLNEDIKILSCREVDMDFDSRRNATARTYVYRLLCLPSNRTDKRNWLFQDEYAWTVHEVNIEEMRSAAACMTGIHDFSSFRNANCQSSTPYRYVYSIAIDSHSSFLRPNNGATDVPLLLVRSAAAVGSWQRSRGVDVHMTVWWYFNCIYFHKICVRTECVRYYTPMSLCMH